MRVMKAHHIIVAGWFICIITLPGMDIPEWIKYGGVLIWPAIMLILWWTKGKNVWP